MDLIPRDGVVEIVGHRDRAVALYAEAFEAIKAADAAVARARAAVRDACGGREPSAILQGQHEEVVAFEHAVKLPDANQYARVARRLTDAAVWAALIERTDLDYLMDKQAKDELRQQMAYIPERVNYHTREVINQDEIEQGLPPVTVENVLATLEDFAADAQSIWRRGLANAFSKLDRRFRSHDGFKIGSRVILTSCFNSSWGPTLDWNYSRSERDTLMDIERVFLTLDGKGPRAAYAGIVGAVEVVTREARESRTSLEFPVVVEGDYFRLRAFKNGNAHLWFERDDLVEKANQELAAHYGATVGYGRECGDEEREQEEHRAVGHAKNLGFFETPVRVAGRVLDDAHLWPRDDRPLRVLEPSAGTGALVRAIRLWEAEHRVPPHHAGRIDCVEVDEKRAAILEGCQAVSSVACRDFLATTMQVQYDRVIMNPPFDRGRDIDHVLHAWKFLKPGGRLVAIMSASTEFREDKKAKDFRAIMEKAGARWWDLPAGSFAPATYVNTLYVAVTKPEE